MKRLLLVMSCFLIFGCQTNQSQHSTNTQAYTSNVQVTIASPLTKNYLLVLDSSGSMGGEDLAIAKSAIRKFISLISSDANIGLIEFGGSVKNRVPLTTDRAQLLNEIDSIRSGGGTPLVEALDTAYTSLKTQYNAQFEYGEYHMVILTDGEGGDGDPIDNVERISADGWCTIHTIGFKIGQSHALNSPDKVRYRSADNLQELEESFKSVLAEAESFDITFN